MLAENITIDDGGIFTAKGQGYKVADGLPKLSDGRFNMGMHGIINPGNIL